MPDRSHPTQSSFNDLRGRAVREVHRDDAVVISGAEYDEQPADA